MKNKPLAKIVSENNPETPPLLSDKQIEGIKTASGIVLAVIAAAGIVTLSAITPNIFTALNQLYKTGKKINKKQKERIVSQTLHYLKKSGKISMARNTADIAITITQLGEKQLQETVFESLQIKRPRHWNGHWWQAAADIPTKTHRAAADALRYKLKIMGFFPLQKTLWYYPFDPRKELQFVIDRYDVNKFVTVMEILRMDTADETILKEHFKKIHVL